MSAMPRRIHVQRLRVGKIILDEREAHHVRDVLRLAPGKSIELFDDSGTAGRGSILRCSSNEVVVRIDSLQQPQAQRELLIASAVPKGERADWMIEKLSELGVDRF